MSNYTKYIYAICTASGKAYGNALARAVGYKGKADAFGVASFLGCRAIGSVSTTPSHYVLYTIAHQDRVPYVNEFNSAGPYTLLNAAGAPSNMIAACKANMVVQIVDTPADIDEYAVQFLADNGLELIHSA